MKALCGVVMLSAFCAFVQAAEDCQHAVSSGDKLYRQFDFGTEFACLYESSTVSDFAVFSFYSKAKIGYNLISSNSRLIDISDVRDGINLPNVTKLNAKEFQVLWDYPNGVDNVELSLVKGGLYLTHVEKEIRLPISIVDGETNTLGLVGKENKSEDIPFSEVVGSELFDPSSLMLRNSESFAAISSDKAYLYAESSEAAITKGYLVKGDVVKVLEYDSGFLKVSYRMKNGKYLIKWIAFSSVI